MKKTYTLDKNDIEKACAQYVENMLSGDTVERVTTDLRIVQPAGVNLPPHVEYTLEIKVTTK